MSYCLRVARWKLNGRSTPSPRTYSIMLNNVAPRPVINKDCSWFTRRPSHPPSVDEEKMRDAPPTTKPGNVLPGRLCRRTLRPGGAWNIGLSALTVSRKFGRIYALLSLSNLKLKLELLLPFAGDECVTAPVRVSKWRLKFLHGYLKEQQQFTWVTRD